jgi:high-affinity Fe2+/Pb2+ permease
MSRRFVRAEASPKRIRRVALLLLVLGVVFGLVLVANIVVLLIITGDRTVLVVQVGILAVLTVLFVSGAWALHRIASLRVASDASDHASDVSPMPRTR